MKNRRSIRLKGYDYRRSGAYFVTICAHRKRHIFGNVLHGVMLFSALGQIVDDEWMKMGEKREAVHLEVHVVMPNHFHALFKIVNDKLIHDENAPAFGKLQAGSLGLIVGGFKAAVSRRAAKELKLSSPVWHRNYYESIIRDEAGYQRVKQYVRNNPARWCNDTFHPDAPPDQFNTC